MIKSYLIINGMTFGEFQQTKKISEHQKINARTAERRMGSFHYVNADRFVKIKTKIFYMFLFFLLKKLKYCNEKCQKAHRSSHKAECNKSRRLFSTTQSTIKHLGINLNRSLSHKSKYGLTGLQNLGNTCFMNSSLQCLSSVADLTEYFVNNEFVKDLNRANPLGTGTFHLFFKKKFIHFFFFFLKGGYLVAVYAELVKDMWIGTDSSVAPWDFKKVIGRFAPQVELNKFEKKCLFIL